MQAVFGFFLSLDRLSGRATNSMADKLKSLLSEVQDLVSLCYDTATGGGQAEASNLLTLSDKIVSQVKPRYDTGTTQTYSQSQQDGLRTERRCLRVV